MVSVHVDNKTRTILSEKLLPVASGKWPTTESKQATCNVGGAGNDLLEGEHFQGVTRFVSPLRVRTSSRLS